MVSHAYQPGSARKALYPPVLVLMVLLGVMPLFVSGCKDDNLPHFDPTFSCNLIIPGPGFPQKKIQKQLTPAQKKVLEEYGPPDYIRVWWDRSGQVKRLMEVHRLIDQREYLKRTLTWLYEDEGIEIGFADKDNYLTAPIEPKIRILMQLGDPEDIRITTHNDVYRETWQYYRAGRVIKFNRDGLIVEDKAYQGTGTWLKP
ncbi:MAG: hypothetical protein Kow0059_18160 [Candidatus Sumerlaeia bacterium]